jgi:hypothetical protein
MLLPLMPGGDPVKPSQDKFYTRIEEATQKIEKNFCCKFQKSRANDFVASREFSPSTTPISDSASKAPNAKRLSELGTAHVQDSHASIGYSNNSRLREC